MAGLLVVAVAVGLLFMRQSLSDWLWPETRAQQLQADAEQALARGKLTSPDGRGARELYAAALARDPDRSEARQGLAKVGQAALGQARAAIESRRYADAHRLLALARELAVPRARVDALQQTLRQREAGDAGIEKLLAQAAAARLAGQLDGSDGAALPLYQRVLALQPNRTEALEGREDTLADLLAQARVSLQRGELSEASSRIRRAQAADPGHVDLPDVLAQLTRVGEQHRAKADGELRRGRLSEALEAYLAALSAMPDDAAAERGLAQVATAYALRSQKYAADFRFDDAEAALRDARAISLQAPAIAEAEQRLVQARQAQQRYGSRVSPPARSSGCRSCSQTPASPKRVATCSRHRATAPTTSCARRRRWRRKIRTCARSRRDWRRRRVVASSRNCAATGSAARANAWMPAPHWKATAPNCAMRAVAWRSAGSPSATSAWARAS